MEDFARMGMGAEAMAVMADLARVEFKDRDAIRDLFVVPEIRHVVLDSRFREPLRQLTEAAKERTFLAYERLDQSISHLRRVAEETPGVPPVSLPEWRPIRPRAPWSPPLYLLDQLPESAGGGATKVLLSPCGRSGRDLERLS